jgi:hypothetical protein
MKKGYIWVKMGGDSENKSVGGASATLPGQEFISKVEPPGQGNSTGAGKRQGHLG